MTFTRPLVLYIVFVAAVFQLDTASIMSTLTAGPHFIRNSVYPISRAHIEDKSLRPKGVFTLREGSEERAWHIKPAGIHGSFFSNDGAPTGTKGEGNKQVLFAFLDGETPTAWKTERVASAGKDSYVIRDLHGKFWVSIPPQPGTPGLEYQIEVKTLILNPVDPPVYPPEAIFEIVKA
ncbi:hypothetical protein D9757_011158 [Collybiopsis confluens]|uniref:Uncharacterized protein n=1 Tax=Collybiopsis confluens TaxID=2823264 RepID=A0A8H5H809_9AGAR|nr:hypothetical protein D9757_011158 [Collybiopsis confluens]